MKYQYPFGEYAQPLVQEDRSPRKAFVLGVYASAVHARWKRGNNIICQALAVASEPRIFWDGNPDEAREIISGIRIPEALGVLEPAGSHLNGPSAKVLDDHILAPLGYTRSDVWLCDCLPETRLNPSQVKVINERYNPLIKAYGLNEVTIPKRPSGFCDEKRAKEIADELMQSQAELLVLLGDIPIEQFLRSVSDVPYSSLQEYVDLYGYGNPADVTIRGRQIKVLPLAHPRQIGALGAHSERWHKAHVERFDIQSKGAAFDALVCDVNRFHSVNELYGRQFGDLVLRSIGISFRKLARKTGGIACRERGDTFLLYCPHRDDYEQLLKKFMKDLYVEEDTSEKVELRFGVFVNAEQETEIEDRFACAKIAANNIIYNPEMNCGYYERPQR